DEETRWSDAVLRKEDIEMLRELAQVSPEIRRLVTALDGKFPLQLAERRSRLAVIREVGETLNEWADVIKKVSFSAAPYVISNWPAVQASVERALAALVLG